MYADESGLVAPFVTRAGQEPDLTGQSEGATRVSGVSIQHTPATRLWFGQVRNLAGYRSVPHHHGEAETGGFVLSGRARIYFGERFEDYRDMRLGNYELADGEIEDGGRGRVVVHECGVTTAA